VSICRLLRAHNVLPFEVAPVPAGGNPTGSPCARGGVVMRPTLEGSSPVSDGGQRGPRPRLALHDPPSGRAGHEGRATTGNRCPFRRPDVAAARPGRILTCAPRHSRNRYCPAHSRSKPVRPDHHERYGWPHRRLRAKVAAEMRARCTRLPVQMQGSSRVHRGGVTSGYALWVTYSLHSSSSSN
jgi:hypothetical protein